MPPNDEIVPGWSIADYLAQGSWDDGTRRRYRHALYALRDYLQQGPPAPLEAALPAWPQTLRQQGYRPRSVNLRIAAANGYLRWCGRYDLTMRHSTLDKTETPQLTRPEYLRLLCTARRKGERQMYLLVKLFATTGLPVQCLEQVTVSLVEAGGGTLRQHGADLQLTLQPAFRQELLDYCRAQGIAAGPVFVTSRGQMLNRSNLCRGMQELCRSAGVDEAKGNPRALRSLYQTTQAYIQASMEQMLRQAYDQLLQTEQVTAGWQEGA